MSGFSPVHKIAIDEYRAELHFAIGGFWTLEKMHSFLGELTKAAAPFLKSRKRFRVLGDLRDFVPQDRSTAEAIRNSLLEAQKNGLTRFALVSTAPLVKLQYKRITDGLDVEFFDSPREAEMWLRQ
ncbi:hypothetical protein [Erythrobacter sp. MTPC3]|uniref:hypothetical protein n=1 Tax=Erythrobacter sp. MTPC3 TaxID=3056564 RepID=UPI0036F32EFC